jgi:hypothetical protein
MSSGVVSAAQAVGFGDRPTRRPRMRLVQWKRVGKGLLIGKATVRLPIGLEIADIGGSKKTASGGLNCPLSL